VFISGLSPQSCNERLLLADLLSLFRLGLKGVHWVDSSVADFLSIFRLGSKGLPWVDSSVSALPSARSICLTRDSQRGDTLG
jgi:hypothetical protein